MTLPENLGFKKGETWVLIPSADKRAFTLIPKPIDLYVQKDQQHTDSSEIQSKADSKEVQ